MENNIDPELAADIEWLTHAPLTEMERDTFGQLTSDHSRTGASIKALRKTVANRIRREGKKP